MRPTPWLAYLAAEGALPLTHDEANAHAAAPFLARMGVRTDAATGHWRVFNIHTSSWPINNGTEVARLAREYLNIRMKDTWRIEDAAARTAARDWIVQSRSPEAIEECLRLVRPLVPTITITEGDLNAIA